MPDSHAWDAVTGASLDIGAVEEGVELAREDFLGAMLPGEEDSAIAGVAARPGCEHRSMVSEYRRRLIDAGVVGSRGRGRVGFEMPFLKEYLEEGP